MDDSNGSNIKPHSLKRFNPLLYLAILFGGTLFADWIISQVLQSPPNTVRILTRMSLQTAIAIAVLGWVFAHRWVTLKTVLFATAILAVGLFSIAVAARMQRQVSASENTQSNLTTAPPAFDPNQPYQSAPDLSTSGPLSTPPISSASLTPRDATLEQQGLCADRAKKFFHDSEFIKPAHGEKIINAPSYISHYDAKANICYVAIRTNSSFDGGKSALLGVAIFDAFEGGTVAGFLIPEGSNVPPLECDVTPLGHEQIICKSEDEFKNLVTEKFGIETTF